MTKRKPEIIFSLIILIFGSLLVLVTPFGGGADEDTHIGRIWEMSTGALVPNQHLSTGPNYPFVFNQISYRQDVNVRPVSWDAWKEQLFSKIDWDNFIHHTTRARYFFTLYLPQAFIMGVMGRLLDLPVGFVYYAIRLSYLLIYALLVYLSIRIIPMGKWLLGFLAATPMSLIQAASISPDSTNNGIAFVFIAWVLYMNSAERRAAFSKKDWFITALLTLAVCTLKLNTVPLLIALLLIPRVKFGPPKWLVGFILFAILAVSIVCLGWNFLTASELLTSTTIDTYNASEQIKLILQDPGRFFRAIGETIVTQTPRYARNWVGISGYDYWPLPEIIYWMTPILIVLAILSDSMGGLLNLRKRLIAVASFGVVFLATIVMFYLLYNPPGTTLIPGVQGRYFLFITPLLFIALLPNRPVLRLGAGWLAAGSAFIAFLTVGALFLAYHLTCGSAWYTTGLCRLPRHKNQTATSSLPVELPAGRTVFQTFQPPCNQLTQASVWLYEHSANSGSLTIAVLNDSSGETVNAREISAAELPSGGWLELDFPPISDSAGQTYTFQITAAGDPPLRGVQVGVSDRNEYLDGELNIGAEAQTGDLFFRYGCLTGLEELLNPAGQ